ncbi:MAG: hypothetical protein ACR2P9_01645 [Gammaproteobacteria bacterium]
MSAAFHAERKKRTRNKNIIDQFYTKQEVVVKCLKKINFDLCDYVVEPSAGDGAFLREIDHHNIYAMDIAPKSKGINRKSFFDFVVNSKYEKVLILGNPPFGMYHSLSDAFLSHSFSFENVKTIGFILPNTYNKHTRQKIIPKKGWRIKSITPLGRDAFIYNGEPYHVPCSFFVFDKSKGRDLRVDPSAHREAKDFIFGTKNDYEFFIFGANPSKIVTKPEPNNRGYFIKPKISIRKLMDRIRSINWAGNSCANGGVAWFTKTEIVAQYNKVYG